MTPSQLNNVKRWIAAYLSSDNPYPYFVSVDGSTEYHSIVEEYSSCNQMRVSDYCEQEDSFPNVDKLFNDIHSLGGNCMLLGIGESISLGCDGANVLLGKLEDLTLPHKLIVVCRSIKSNIRKMSESDQKFNERRFVVVDSSVDYYVVHLADDIPSSSAEKGFRKLLTYLEQGKPGEVLTKSSLPLRNVREIRTCYMLLRKEGKLSQIDESVLPEEYWRSYFEDDNLEGYGLTEWRTYLKALTSGTNSPYLQLVISMSENYETYKKMLLQAILFVDEKDARFETLYADRKKVLEKEIDAAAMAAFVAESKRKGSNRVHYLTDITKDERRAIIEDIAKYGTIPADIELTYPALACYLFDYTFSCSNGKLFTSYFSKYKRQKLLNAIDPAFLKQVLELAQDGNRAYNALDSRNSIIEQLFDPGTYLYWIDALGVEYLGYIQKRAQSLGLSMNAHIARASLPTLTYLNKDFFDGWPGDKYAQKQLDILKHDGEEGPESRIGELPTHIVSELEIIDQFLDFAQRRLASRKSQRVVLASDHGASRLAVIYNNENKWTMQSKGEHSGRCCPASEIDERPSCAIKENEYWVLANYDRFKGSRKARVEVHGGASLEEVLIPIVELALKDASVQIECLTEVTHSSFNEHPTVELFSISPLKNLSVRLDGNIYRATTVGEGRFEVSFDDLKRTGVYKAEVYEGDDLLGEITFSVQKRTAKSNDDDEWFN